MTDSPISILIVLALIGYFVYHISTGMNATPMICKSCGTAGEGHTVTKGSLGIEIILWLCFLLPGLIYTVWRKSSQFNGCEVCGSQELIPVDSPIGRRIVYENSKRIAA